ncbi:hypothetical protein Tsp_00468 [Trichinella spiralis]|uniref:hypothetical protein n=1 Tax=Trichinella spiralis TaxID=6334 RepID=UPI0001EFB884|nr:hypothetical protein Tsp_00468 [Trichinella spiralis]
MIVLIPASALISVLSSSAYLRLFSISSNTWLLEWHTFVVEKLEIIDAENLSILCAFSIIVLIVNVANSEKHPRQLDAQQLPIDCCYKYFAQFLALKKNESRGMPKKQHYSKIALSEILLYMVFSLSIQ